MSGSDLSATLVPYFTPDPSLDNPFEKMMGWPIIVNQALPSPTAGVFTANSTPILFGDFKRAYLLRLGGSPFIKRLDERFMDTLETGFVSFFRAGGIALNQTNAETGEPAVSPVVSLKIAAS